MFHRYLWLARRFPGEFVSIKEAQEALKQTEQLIQDGLERMGGVRARRARRDSPSTTLPNRPPFPAADQLLTKREARKQLKQQHRGFVLHNLDLQPRDVADACGIDVRRPFDEPRRSLADAVRRVMRAHGLQYDILSNKQRKQARRDMKKLRRQTRRSMMRSSLLHAGVAVDDVHGALGEEGDELSQPSARVSARADASAEDFVPDDDDNDDDDNDEEEDEEEWEQDTFNFARPVPLHDNFDGLDSDDGRSIDVASPSSATVGAYASVDSEMSLETAASSLSSRSWDESSYLRAMMTDDEWATAPWTSESTAAPPRFAVSVAREAAVEESDEDDHAVLDVDGRLRRLRQGAARAAKTRQKRSRSRGRMR